MFIHATVLTVLPTTFSAMYYMTVLGTSRLRCYAAGASQTASAAPIAALHQRLLQRGACVLPLPGRVNGRRVPGTGLVG